MGDEASFKQQVDYITNLLSSPLVDLDDGDANNDDDSEGSNEDYSENEDYEEYDVNELGDYLKDNEAENDNYIQGDQFLFDHYQSANKPKKELTQIDASPRMPKYVSPTKGIETELK